MSRGGVTVDLVRRCETIADDGTDPDALARVLAWAVRPRRSLDALRRRCRDDPHDDDRAGVPSTVLADHAAPDLHPDDARAAAGIVAVWEELACRVALVGDAGYPPRLADGWPQTDAPTLVARRGPVLRAEAPSVAIVGSRRASGYGTAVAAWLAEAVAAAGGRVVSGGAVGIDAAAHRAACSLPGGTTVVLGCGHGVPYPRPHARPGGLFDQVLDNAGALLSELLPAEPPRAGQVRARNRIVAALADVVVVVEGGARSGSLLTAGAAADRGRTVMAVPGDVRAPGSAAPHRLLQEGVAPCTGPDDLLDALGRATELPPRADPDVDGDADADAADGASPRASRPVSVLPDDVHRVLAEAWPRPVRIDALAEASGRPTGSLLATLTRARVAGELAEDAGGVRLRRAPRSS